MGKGGGFWRCSRISSVVALFDEIPEINCSVPLSPTMSMARLDLHIRFCPQLVLVLDSVNGQAELQNEPEQAQVD